MVKVHRTHYPVEWYLEFDETTPGHFEYLDGVIYAMAGGTGLHSALASQVLVRLDAQLGAGRCRAYNSDLRIEVEASGLFTYPDVTVFSGPLEKGLSGQKQPSYRNPTVIAEVLSPSTEEYDRDEKFEHYARLPALREYVLVSQDTRRIEVRSRASESTSWTTRVFEDGQVALLPAVGAQLDVRAIYERAQQPA